MSMWQGAVLALSAAVVHTIADSLRKHFGTNLSPVALVGLVAVLDAVLACSGVALAGGFKGVRFHDRHTFSLAVLTSSGLLLYAKYLYQQALSTSHLSLTVPYLSFTPTFLVFTAFLFLGEVPSWSGLVGVAIVTAGGYLLSKTSGGSGSSSGSSTASKGAQGPESDWLDGEQDLNLGSKGSLGALTPSPSAGTLHSVVVMGGGGVGRTVSRTGSTGTAALQNGESTTPTHSRLLATPPAGVEGGGSGVVLGRTADKLVARAGSRMGGRSVSTSGSGRLLPLLPMHGSGSVAGEGGGDLAPPRGISRAGTGQLMMVLVAAMWSVTATLDKLGCLHAPSVWVFFALQRLVIGLAAAAYLIMYAPHTFSILRTRALWSLLALSLMELSAIVMFLEAIKYVFVSYVVAIKRANILFSVVVGGLVFKENVLRRLPYVAMMLAGMLCIVLEPGASSSHQTTHT